MACRADALITTNARDFVWDQNLSSYEVLSPDDFFLLVDDADPALVRTVISSMCSYWVGRTGSANLPERLRAAGCPTFADRGLAHLHHMM